MVEAVAEDAVVVGAGMAVEVATQARTLHLWVAVVAGKITNVASFANASTTDEARSDEVRVAFSYFLSRRAFDRHTGQASDSGVSLIEFVCSLTVSVQFPSS